MQPVTRLPNLPPPDGSQQATILLVEDDVTTRKLFELYLRNAGYQVEVATSGEQALAKAIGLHPAAIVLDIILPVIDGWDVLDMLKGSAETRDIPVVIVSVLDQTRAGFRRGAVEFLVKPVNRRGFLQAVERSLHRHYRGRPARVLIVHQDTVMLAALAEALVREGYETVCALGAAEALYLALSLELDLIILDLWLSEGGCFDVISELRRHPQTSSVPIRVLTSRTLTREYRSRLRQAGRIRLIDIGPDDPLQKLIGAVDHALQRRVRL